MNKIINEWEIKHNQFNKEEEAHQYEWDSILFQIKECSVKLKPKVGRPKKTDEQKRINKNEYERRYQTLRYKNDEKYRENKKKKNKNKSIKIMIIG